MYGWYILRQHQPAEIPDLPAMTPPPAPPTSDPAIAAEGRRVMHERRRLGNAWLAGGLARLTPPQPANLAAAPDAIEQVVLAEGGAGGTPMGATPLSVRPQ